jgi:AcrR family transcriptional regulator
MISDSQDRLLHAATLVFVEGGFSGARVDEIARRARVNKAMIYYHFGNKKALYQAVLLRLLEPIHEHIAFLRASGLAPRERIRRFYSGFARRFAEQPALPHVMIREVLAGGRHMDRATAQAFAGMLGFVSETLEEGRQARQFRRVNALAFHLAVLAPLLMFFVSTPFRERMAAAAVVPPGLRLPTLDDMLAQVEETLARGLEACEPREELS